MSKSSRRGRPRLADGEATVTLTVRVPTRQFDRLCEEAADAKLTLAESVRRRLNRSSPDSRPKPSDDSR